MVFPAGSLSVRWIKDQFGLWSIAVRELDKLLGLNDPAVSVHDTRPMHSDLNTVAGALRLSVFTRLAVYEDVNGADRIAVDPMLWQPRSSRPCSK